MSFTYRGLKATLDRHIVTGEEIDRQIERLRQQNPRIAHVDNRPTENGDEVVLDYAGFCNGVQFPGGTAEKQTLVLGSGTFIPGFEEQLVDRNIGEEFEVNVTFPEDYQSDELAGCPAVFKCTVKKITEKILPELDDEFASEVSEFSTLEEYKADVRRKLTERKEKTAQTNKENMAVGKVIEDSHVDIPEAMLRTQQEQIVGELEQQITSQGMKFEDYLQYAQTTREKMIENAKDDAERRIMYRLVMEQVAKEENITTTEEDYENELKEKAEVYRLDVETIRKYFEHRKEEMMEELAIQKAITFIADNAVEVEKKPESEEAKTE